MTDGRAVSLIRTMLDPQFQRVDVAPDIGRSGVSSFVGSIDYSLTYNIAANPAKDEGTINTLSQRFFNDVSTFNRGMYIAFPQYGVDRVFHYGFVDAGAYLQVSGYPALTIVRGLGTFGYVGSRPTAVSTTAFAGYRMEYGSELALPRVGSGVGFQIEPELEQNYSKLRSFAYKMVMSSTTISGTNFNLSGTFSSGVIGDTRDICQIVGANGVSRAFPTAALSQQSITKGDVLRTSSVAEGAVDLMGPDYPREWTQPKNDGTDELRMQWEKPALANTSKTLVTGATITATQAPVIYDGYQYWVTPWDTDFWVANGTSPGVTSQKPANHERVRVTPINEDGVLDIDFYFTPILLASAAGDLNLARNLSLASFVNAVHVFAYIDIQGKVQYNTFTETVESQLSLNTVQALAGGATGTEFQNGQAVPLPNVCVKLQPRKLNPGFAVTTGGKYLGTLISMTHCFTNYNTETNQTLPATYPGVVTIASSVFQGTVTAAFNNVSMRVGGRNSDSDGRVGLAHIVRYDDVTEGQQLQFQGTALIQGVAQGKLQPFVGRAVGTLSVPDTMLTKLLDLLWGRSERFRRICTLREYRDRIIPYAQELTAATIQDAINKFESGDERAIATMSAQAAGLFGSLGEGIGSLFGAGDIGRALGGIGDKVFGTGSATFDQQPWEGKSDTLYMRGNMLLDGAGARRGREQ